MFYNAKEEDIKISTGNVHYITFGKGFSENYLKKNKMFIPLSLKMQKFMDKNRFIALANRRIYEFLKKEI